ncbi:MAG: uroporphyrinogen-III C-methyltransferase [Planctomycetota bacterium]
MNSASLPGTVYLVGAGPGDPRLITLRAWHLLQCADVILYDGLINEEILECAPKDCVKHCVGKRGHGGTWKQSQINDFLVDTARSFRHVVRLKGGDTGVFARTAEEVERLEAEGIRYEIVPGITAALAVSAYTGIPITHRDWSSCIALVTGQGNAADGYSESEELMDWDSLARFPGTLILYMGVASAPQWSRSLIQAGKPASTPVALIRKCSWPDQQTLRCDLGSVEATLQSHPEFTPPVISIVGEVVRAASHHAWFSQQPLQGTRFVITGPIDQGRVLREMLAEHGAQCMLAPVIEIAPPSSWSSLDAAIDALPHTDWLIFSSVHGVRSFFERLRHLGQDARALRSTRVAAVGPSTADAMLPYGIRCDLVPSLGAGVEALWSDLQSFVAGRSVTVVRAPEGKTFLLERLDGVASRVIDCEAYRQQPISAWPDQSFAAIEAFPAPIIVATSSRIAARTVELLGKRAPGMRWLSISGNVTRTLQALGCLQVTTSASSTFEYLVQTALEMCDGNERTLRFEEPMRKHPG